MVGRTSRRRARFRQQSSFSASEAAATVAPKSAKPGSGGSGCSGTNTGADGTILMAL